MKNFLLATVVVSTLLFSGCMIHLPYDVWDDYQSCRIILKVNPDDAQVLLNGRMIGEAFEFATEASALRLANKRGELIIKKGGFIEEVIDLYDYATRTITINITLTPDTEKTRAKDLPESRKKELAYLPKYEDKKEEPESLEDIPLSEGKPMFRSLKLLLEISPAESSIYINDKFWGIVPESGHIENIRLKKGTYKLAVVKPGYKPFNKTVVTKDKNLTLKIILEKEKK